MRCSLRPDEADNRVLECALEGGADMVVTGDRHLLDLHGAVLFPILKPEAFLSVLRTAPAKVGRL
jgi:predicted nucleic acid-binding protein